MALSDLAVFSEWVYSAKTEVLQQQVELFNEASDNTMLLSAVPHTGDYSDEASWKLLAGLVRRRNPYGSGTVAALTLQHLVDTMVKIAAGTPPVRIDPGQFAWIQRSPQEAGAVIGQQLAVASLADMVNTAAAAVAAALSGQAAIIYDGTADTPDTMNARMLNRGASKFGDRSNRIAAWLMHSTPLADFYDNALQNASQLFTYGTVNVVRDPFGRRFIVSDIPALVTAGTPNIYSTLGLVPGAVRVDTNGDFTDNVDTTNGDENILRTYQAEWSYSLGILGFTWDKTNGGKAPTNSALATATNWDKTATDIKNLAGVLVKSN
jgi:hypothetical protein